MGVMNKMKTVVLRDLGTWTVARSRGRQLFACTPSDGKVSNSPNSPIRAVCDGYVAVSTNKTWVDKDMAYTQSSGARSITLVNNSFATVADFLASEGDKTITYEIVDSVEEKIVSPFKVGPFTLFAPYVNPQNIGTVTITNKLITIKRTQSGGQIGAIAGSNKTGVWAVHARALTDKRTNLRLYGYDGASALGWSARNYILTKEWATYVFDDLQANRAEIQLYGAEAGAECEIDYVAVSTEELTTEEII